MGSRLFRRTVDMSRFKWAFVPFVTILFYAAQVFGVENGDMPVKPKPKKIVRNGDLCERCFAGRRAESGPGTCGGCDGSTLCKGNKFCRKCAGEKKCCVCCGRLFWRKAESATNAKDIPPQEMQLRKALVGARKKLYDIEIRRLRKTIKEAKKLAGQGDRYEANRLPQLERRLVCLKKDRRELKPEKIEIKQIIYEGKLVPHSDYFRIESPLQSRSGPFYHVVGARDGLKSLEKFSGKWCGFKLYFVDKIGFTTYVYADEVKETDMPKSLKKRSDRKENR